ncbi:MAG: UDP-N-acetylglucosamine 1-carboxyvinyltransferase [Calditerrivibrio sp.]|nr:UDP-N-acetylglucosamine 1-carboxyvinyltransferase [Calditerrivibrio sp.]
MDKFVINGGKQLNGRIKISGAKNSALPILTATILADGDYSLGNIPNLMDVRTMLKLLGVLDIKYNFSENSVHLKNLGNNELYTAPYELVKTMRASVLVLGPLLARRGFAKVSLPGGCAIGERPVDQHMKALAQMGAKIDIEHGYIVAEAARLKGCEVYFDMVTVTGTENIMMAATLAEGETVLYNAAQEPEVVDLAKFLKKMGAKITGEGTNVITIKGVSELRPADYIVMPDRIEAGTVLCAVAATGGDVVLEDAPVDCMKATIDKIIETGCKVDIVNSSTLRIVSNGKLRSADVVTQPYPGFATDMQAQFMAIMTRSQGISVITENIFENRFMHVSELKRMGADIRLKDRSAVIRGVEKLSGADIMASDLRASAGLVIAGLIAEGTTNIHRIYHLDRGYENFDIKLNNLGADIRRDKDE